MFGGMKARKDEQYTPEETARRRDEAIRRALNTPPKPPGQPPPKLFRTRPPVLPVISRESTRRRTPVRPHFAIRSETMGRLPGLADDLKRVQPNEICRHRYQSKPHHSKKLHTILVNFENVNDIVSISQSKHRYGPDQVIHGRRASNVHY